MTNGQLIMPIGVARELTEELTAAAVQAELRSVYNCNGMSPDENCLAWYVADGNWAGLCYTLGLIMGCDNYDFAYVAMLDTPIHTTADGDGVVVYWPRIHVDHNQQ